WKKSTATTPAGRMASITPSPAGEPGSSARRTCYFGAFIRRYGAAMSIRFIGANPCVTLSASGGRVAFASVWRADWSERGSGRALVACHGGASRVVAPDAALRRWPAPRLTRHFPVVRRLPWPGPEIPRAPVGLEVDREAGMRAVAADVTVEIARPP